MASFFFGLQAQLAVLAVAATLAACSVADSKESVAQARAALARDDFAAAIIEAKVALQQDADLAEARYLLGLALLRSGDAKSAEAELRKAWILPSAAPAVTPALARALLADGQYGRLIGEFSAVEMSDLGDQADLKTSLAAAHALQGNADLAQAAVGAALAADPQYVPAQMVDARGRAARNDVGGALTIVDSITARAPTNHEAWLLKGDLLRRRKGNGDAALAAYRRALESKPKSLAGHLAVVNILLAQDKLADAATAFGKLKELAPNHLQTNFLETLLAYQQGRYAQAADLAKHLLTIAPADLRCLQLAGAIALERNDLAQAQAQLGRVVQGAPKAWRARLLLVSAKLRAGHTANALTLLLPALADGEPDAATSAIAGDVYRQSGDLKKAEAYFARAARLAPDDARPRASLALTHLAAGRRDEGLDELQALSNADSDITADLALIGAELLSRDFDAALRAIDALEAKLPGKPQAPSLRGRALMMRGDHAGARKSMEKALAIDPTYFQAADGLATLDLADHKPEQARKRFDALLAKNPADQHVLLALARVRTLSGAPSDEVGEAYARAVRAGPQNVTPRLMQVEFHLSRNELAEALAAAQDGVGASPSSAMMFDSLGRAQQASGDLRQAVVSFTKAAGLRPQSVLHHMRLAAAQLAASETAAAEKSLHKALDLRPDLIEAQVQLIALATDGKDFDTARGMVRTVQAQRPRQAVGYLLESNLAMAQNKPDGAVMALRKGLRQTPATELAQRLHERLVAAGNAGDAKRFVADWLRDHPRDVLFRLYLGDQAVIRNDLAAAEDQYANVTQIEPTNALALNNLAWVSGRLNKPQAVDFAEKAVALAPGNAGHMDTLAMLLSHKGDYAQALQWETKALQVQPWNAVLRLNLAKIHIKGGRKDLARSELERLTALGDKFMAQAEVTRMLKSL